MDADSDEQRQSKKDQEPTVASPPEEAEPSAPAAAERGRRRRTSERQQIRPESGQFSGDGGYNQADSSSQSRLKLLLEKSSTKVLLFCYMRGGSTLFSQLFNIDHPRSLLFYEPMDTFYQSQYGIHPNAIPLSLLYEDYMSPRKISESEIIEMTDYLESLLNCRLDELPMETFAHNYLGHSPAFMKQSECMSGKGAKQMLKDCINPINEICGNTDIIRRNMSVAIENRCPEIIKALKITLPNRLQPDKKKAQQKIKDISTLEENVSKLIGGFSEYDHLRFHRFVKYHTCKSEATYSLDSCLENNDRVCSKVKTIALKVIRLRMKDLELLIQRVPDIHILYFTRDPRAIATSRLKNADRLSYSPIDARVSTEARILCHRMWDDLRAKKMLERKYPGSITTIRYEDFVQDLNGTSLNIFAKIGLERPRGVETWLRTIQTGSSFNGPYGIKRPNATAIMKKWMLGVEFQEGVEMTKWCQPILTELGYQLY